MTPGWNRRRANQIDESLKAELVLADMELCEEFALLFEDETCPKLRVWFARKYERLIGVHPDARSELGQALTRIAEGGGAVVSDVIDQCRRAFQQNGSLSDNRSAVESESAGGESC